MSLEARNTSNLVNPEKLKLKILIYAASGTGKTLWAGSAPKPGFLACETGHGRGTLTLAGHSDVLYVEPATLDELKQGLSPAFEPFKDRETIVLDSLTAMNDTFIKDTAVSWPRAKGSTPKRQVGVPELDDYGSMAELVRQMLIKALALDKHVIVTAGFKVDKPDAELPGDLLKVGPALPGQMLTIAPSMFDLVFCMRTRVTFKNPKDPTTRYYQRFLMTEGDGTTQAKCRLLVGGKPVFDREEIIDLETGQGMFPYLLSKAKEAYIKAGVGK